MLPNIVILFHDLVPENVHQVWRVQIGLFDVSQDIIALNNSRINDIETNIDGPILG